MTELPNISEEYIVNSIVELSENIQELLEFTKRQQRKNFISDRIIQEILKTLPIQDVKNIENNIVSPLLLNDDKELIEDLQKILKTFMR